MTSEPHLTTITITPRAIPSKLEIAVHTAMLAAWTLIAFACGFTAAIAING